MSLTGMVGIKTDLNCNQKTFWELYFLENICKAEKNWVKKDLRLLYYLIRTNLCFKIVLLKIFLIFPIVILSVFY